MPGFLSVTPSPATPPCWILVCYQLGTVTLPITLRIVLSPSSIGTSYEEINQDTETSPEGVACVAVYLPANCTGGIVVDESGQSTDAAIIVVP